MDQPQIPATLRQRRHHTTAGPSQARSGSDTTGAEQQRGATLDSITPARAAELSQAIMARINPSDIRATPQELRDLGAALGNITPISSYEDVMNRREAMQQSIASLADGAQSDADRAWDKVIASAANGVGNVLLKGVEVLARENLRNSMFIGVAQLAFSMDAGKGGNANQPLEDIARMLGVDSKVAGNIVAVLPTDDPKQLRLQAIGRYEAGFNLSAPLGVNVGGFTATEIVRDSVFRIADESGPPTSETSGEDTAAEIASESSDTRSIVVEPTRARADSVAVNIGSPPIRSVPPPNYTRIDSTYEQEPYEQEQVTPQSAPSNVASSNDGTQQSGDIPLGERWDQTGGRATIQVHEGFYAARNWNAPKGRPPRPTAGAAKTTFHGQEFSKHEHITEQRAQDIHKRVAAEGAIAAGAAAGVSFAAKGLGVSNKTAASAGLLAATKVGSFVRPLLNQWVPPNKYYTVSETDFFVGDTNTRLGSIGPVNIDLNILLRVADKTGYTETTEPTSATLGLEVAPTRTSQMRRLLAKNDKKMQAVDELITQQIRELELREQQMDGTTGFLPSLQQDVALLEIRTNKAKRDISRLQTRNAEIAKIFNQQELSTQSFASMTEISEANQISDEELDKLIKESQKNQEDTNLVTNQLHHEREILKVQKDQLREIEASMDADNGLMQEGLEQLAKLENEKHVLQKEKEGLEKEMSAMEYENKKGASFAARRREHIDAAITKRNERLATSSAESLASKLKKTN